VVGEPVFDFIVELGVEDVNGFAIFVGCVRVFDGGWVEDEDDVVVVGVGVGFADAESAVVAVEDEGAVGLDLPVEEGDDVYPGSAGSAAEGDFFVVGHYVFSVATDNIC